MKYCYYPGCSLTSTSIEYELSARAVCSHLGIELDELEDWNCCGASSVHGAGEQLAIALAARNLALASRAGLDIAVPCSACYNRLKTADHRLRADAGWRQQIHDRLGINYSQPAGIYSLLEVMIQFGLENLRAKVIKPLAGLNAACYYGCLLVRPPGIVSFDADTEYPVLMDHLVEMLGGKAVRWFYKTDCCGAGLAVSRGNMVQEMVTRILRAARNAGAGAVVTACPLCHVNLEMRRANEETMPVFYFTELMALAFDLPDCRRWLAKHLVDPRPLLAGLNIL